MPKLVLEAGCIVADPVKPEVPPTRLIEPDWIKAPPGSGAFAIVPVKLHAGCVSAVPFTSQPIDWYEPLTLTGALLMYTVPLPVSWYPP